MVDALRKKISEMYNLKEKDISIVLITEVDNSYIYRASFKKPKGSYIDITVDNEPISKTTGYSPSELIEAKYKIKMKINLEIEDTLIVKGEQDGRKR